MVFYAPPKRRVSSPDVENSNGTIFAEFPDELLLEILKDVDLQTVLKFRATCRRFRPASYTIMGERLTRLYVHTSPSSLTAAVDIMAHSHFSTHINEVVLLGSTFTRRELQRPAPYGVEDSPMFRPWPAKFPTKAADPSDASPRNFEQWSCFQKESPTTLEVLTEALSRLPKLRTLVFDVEVSKSAFNQATQSELQFHAQKYARRFNTPSPIIDVDETGLATRRVTRFSDAEIFYHLLSSSSTRITSIRQGRELPCLVPSERWTREWRLGSNMLSALNSITSIDIAVGDEFPDDWLGAYHHLLKGSRETLVHLRLALLPSLKWHRPTGKQVFCVVFDDLTFPRLKRLKLHSIDLRPVTEHSNTQRHQRPFLSSGFDFYDFVSRHIGTLTELSIENCLFEYNRNLGLLLLETMQDVRKLLNPIKSVENFEWLVNQYRHDPRCRKPDSAPLNCRRTDCGVYTKTFLSVDFDTMAYYARLGSVPLDEERRVWDFAKDELLPRGAR